MLSKATEIAKELGFAEKVKYHQGDIVQANGEIPDADIVVLDKVLCCYTDAHTLIAKSTARCRDVYAVSYPRDSFLARLTFKTSSFVGSVLKWSFHPVYHEPEMLDAVIVGSGLSEVSSATTIIWQIKVFRQIRD
jgi:magnesium-protoporphyrin O-methyltransferase